MFIALAWRNVWRNKRRSSITIAAISMGMAGIIFMIAMLNGFLVNMIDNSVRLETGTIQIHKQGYHDDPAVEKLVREPDLIVEKIRDLKEINGISKRIKSFGLISTKSDSAGAMIVGIDPEDEKAVTNLYKNVSIGSYDSISKYNTIIIGKTLAQNLEVKLGDEIVLLTQGADGSMGNDLYTVGGIFETASPDIDRMFIYMSLGSASDLLSTYGGVNEIALSIEDPGEGDKISNIVAKEIGDSKKYEVLPWSKILPGVSQMVLFFDGAIYIFYFIIFGIAAFGISNTLIMSIFERIHEIGVMMAIGTKPLRVFVQTAVESVIMGLVGGILGCILGFLVSLPFMVYGLNVNIWAGARAFIAFSPIIYFKLNLGDFVLGMSFVLIVTALASIYPAFKASKLKPADAIRYV